jgi:indole-3-glycerol phosphate synthase
MNSFSLDSVLAAVASRAAGRRRERSLDDLRSAVGAEPSRRKRFLGALSGECLSLIAEFKRRAPSSGALADEPDPSPRLHAYAEAGASAVSILTEQDFFDGSLADLEAGATCGLPRLRKDFILDEAMVLESALNGADAILLIVACIDGGLLGELRAAAGEHGLAVLVEVHGPEELDRALDTSPDCLGVNSRNLKTLEINPEAAAEVLARIPEGPLKVAESGVSSLEGLLAARAFGADAALVGTALMREKEPLPLLASWVHALAEEASHA